VSGEAGGTMGFAPDMGLPALTLLDANGLEQAFEEGLQSVDQDERVGNLDLESRFSTNPAEGALE
jgi:hypothetical protein